MSDEAVFDADGAPPSRPLAPQISAAETLGTQTSSALPPPTLGAGQYNRDEQLDNARKRIAYSLLAILAGVIVLIVFVPLVWFLVNRNTDTELAELVIQLVNIVFGPVVTLVGSATGFYFGAQAAKSAG